MTQRFPLKDRVDLQDEKLLRVADGTDRSDGVNLGQLQDATSVTVPDYNTQSNIQVRTNELTTERYVFRVQNNTETALGEGSNLVINGSTIPAENRDISRGVGAGRFEYFSFTIPTAVLSNLQRNPNNVEVDITFGTGGNAVTVRVADEVSSHVGVTYDLSLESNSIDNSVDIRLSGGDGSQDNVVVEGGDRVTVAIDANNRLAISAAIDDITLYRFNTNYTAGQIILQTQETEVTVDGETIITSSAGGLFIATQNFRTGDSFSTANLVPVPLTEVEWAGKEFDNAGFYERGDTATILDGSTWRLYILTGVVSQDGRLLPNRIQADDGPGGTNNLWTEVMSGGGGGALVEWNPTAAYAIGDSFFTSDTPASRYPTASTHNKVYRVDTAIAADSARTDFDDVVGSLQLIGDGDTTYAPFTGADGTNAGTAGLVPAPAADDNDQFLRGDGIWAAVDTGSPFTGATSSAAGTQGLVPAPIAGEQDEFLRGDGTWAPAGGSGFANYDSRGFAVEFPGSGFISIAAGSFGWPTDTVNPQGDEDATYTAPTSTSSTTRSEASGTFTLGDFLLPTRGTAFVDLYLSTPSVDQQLSISVINTTRSNRVEFSGTATIPGGSSDAGPFHTTVRLERSTADGSLGTDVLSISVENTGTTSLNALVIDALRIGLDNDEFRRFGVGSQPVANLGVGTETLSTLEVGGVTYRIPNAVPPHASLVPFFNLRPTFVQLPLSNNVTITGTPGATIRDAESGDNVNRVTINSVHASIRNDTVSIGTGVFQTFTWEALTTDTAQVVTFTCSYTVNYTIGGVNMEHTFTETSELDIRGAGNVFWTGTLTQDQFDGRDSLSNSLIRTTLTEMSDFSSPFTSEYTGAAVPTNVYAALYAPSGVTISSVRSEGFISSFVSVTPTGGTGMTLYIVDDPLSEGVHNFTWRS